MVLGKLQADLKEFIELLNSRNVEYVVVGGHAVAFHGHPRFTGDIAFLIRMTSPNVQRLLAVLDDFGLPASASQSATSFSPGGSFSWGSLQIGSIFLLRFREWILTRHGRRVSKWSWTINQ